MNEQNRHNGSHAIKDQDVIAALWRQAGLGSAAAQRALLWWMMHASAMETSLATIEFDLRRTYLQLERAAV